LRGGSDGPFWSFENAMRSNEEGLSFLKAETVWGDGVDPNPSIFG
jgi:hypothetical protein